MDAIFSKTLKSGKTTFFFDVNTALNKSKYLTITASFPSKDDPQKFSRRTINIFSTAADDFVGALKEGCQLESPFNKMVKSGRVIYFIDLKEAKNGAKYVSITSSQPSKEDPKKYTRRSINIFDNAATDFLGAVVEAATYLK